MFRKTLIILAMIFAMMGPRSVAWGQETTVVASYSRSGTTDTTTGGTFSQNLSGKSGYYQDNSSNQTYYMQLKNANAYWTNTPNSISFTANLGGGTTKDPLGDGRMYVVLLDDNGNEITSTVTEVTNKITSTTGSEFTVSITPTQNVYGVKLYHSKISSYNVRYYSMSLSYIAGGTTPTCTIDPTLHDFDEITVGENATFDFTVTTANLTEDLTLAVSEGFSVSPATIESTETETTVTVTCTPTAVGTFDGTLTISGGGLTDDVTATLSATGLCTAPANELSYETPIALTLTGTEVETTLTPIENTGNGGTITYELIEGDDTHAIVDGNTFMAEAVGSYTVRATQDLNGTTCGGTFDIVINVTSTSPTCFVDQTEWDFGNVAIGTPANKTFTVTTANLTGNLTLYMYDGSNFSVSPTTIEQNATETEITVTCTATTAGELEDILTISGGGLEPEVEVLLSATGVETYTINYMVNGTNTGAQENVVKGTALVFPEVSAPDADHVFCGWVTEAIEGTTDTEPAYVNTTGLTATQNNTYYAVFAERSGSEPAEQKTQTLQYDTWTYYGTTTDKSSYRLFGNGSYIESAAFDLSKLSKVIVYGGTFGGDKYNSLTIGDGTNTWKSVTVSGSSQTGINTYTSEDATALSGTGKLRVTATAGDGKNNGLRISKVEIFTMEGGYTYSNYCTTIVTKVLTSISLSGEYPTVFWKGDAFSHEGMTVTAHYSNAPDADVTSKATFSTPDMTTAGEQEVIVTYDTKQAKYNITVKTIVNTQETAYTVAEAKALIDANPAELATIKVYVKGTISQVDSYNSTYHSITYWISEDGTTTNQFEVYSGKNLNNTDFASKDDVKVGDDVVVYGIIKKFNSTYEFDKNNYLVYHDKVATLSINDITVEIDGTITPVIETNVVGNYTISYTSDNEEVVLADGDKMVTMGLGEATITAKLTAAGYKDAETTFTVKVIKALTFIEIATGPTVTDYKAGDKFDPTGLVITANYNDESTEDVAYAGNEDKFTFEPSLETALTTENTSVTITYAGKTTTQEITVRDLYTYDITWKANGEQFATTQVTEGDALALPETNPANVGDMIFQGWINTDNYYDAEIAPEYIVPSEIIPTEAMTFYAVYAKATEESGIKEFLFSITKDDFTTTSYANNNGSHDFTATCTTDDTKQMTVACTTNQVYQNSSSMQWQSESGYIYNTTDLGTIKSVEVNSITGTFTTYYGTSEHPTSGTTVGNGFFTVQVGNATGKTSSVEVTFEKETQVIIYSNFCTTVKPIEEDKTISENTVWNGNITINEHTVTIGSGAVLTVNGALINTDPANLVIEDGAQLIFNNGGSSKDNNINSGVKATVEKNIIPYGRGGKGWHFLAAPMTDFAVASFIEQAGEGEGHGYDLYRWYIKDNGDPIWYNYKAHIGEFEINFVSGRGYLAAYETNDICEMKGTLNAGTTFDFTSELNSNGNFTLLGNPFTYDLKWSDFTMTHIYKNGFAELNSEDGTIDYVGGTSIKVGTGFMVYTNGESATLSFTKDNGSGSGKSNDILALNLFASNGNGEDNTIIVIDDENGGFAKASNFNTNVPQIYTERLQTKYGIRNFNTSTKEFNVSFKAAGEGSNTIRLETIGEFDYVHLYDKLTDVDVDMLLEGSYTFEASEGDDTHRFIVRIDKGNTGIDENETENFVSVYNGEIHVSGSGEVQIFDVMGRMVHSEVISGDATISTGGFKGGVYVVRLIGDGWTKTEKIVVRR